MRKIDRKCLSYVFSSKGDSLEFDVLILHVPIFCRISCCLFGATDTLWIYIYFYYNTFFFFFFEKRKRIYSISSEYTCKRNIGMMC